MPDAASLALTQVAAPTKPSKAVRVANESSEPTAQSSALIAELSALPFAVLLQAQQPPQANPTASLPNQTDGQQLTTDAIAGSTLTVAAPSPESFALTASLDGQSVTGTATGQSNPAATGITNAAPGQPQIGAPQAAATVNDASASTNLETPEVTVTVATEQSAATSEADAAATGAATTPSAAPTQATLRHAEAVQNLLNGRVLREWGAPGAQGSAASKPAAATVGASSSNSITKSANGNFASVLSGEGNSGTADGASGAAGSAPTTVLTDPAKPVLDPAKPVDVRQQKQHEQALQAPAATASASNAVDTQQTLDISSPVSDAGNTSTPSQQGHRADVPRMPAAHLPLLAASMMKRLDNGSREFTLRLDPAELGRIDVKLEMTADRKVRAVIAAEKPEGLAELQRSARDLEQALTDAGLDLADNGLSFSLNDGAGDNQSANGDQAANQPRFKSRQPDIGQEAMPEAINNSGPRQAGTHDIWKRARVSISA